MPGFSHVILMGISLQSCCHSSSSSGHQSACASEPWRWEPASWAPGCRNPSPCAPTSVGIMSITMQSDSTVIVSLVCVILIIIVWASVVCQQCLAIRNCLFVLSVLKRAFPSPASTQHEQTAQQVFGTTTVETSLGVAHAHP